MRPLLALTLLASCVPKTAVPPSSSPSSQERPLLVWEARKGDVVSHVMGTCHLTIPLQHALPSPHDLHLSKARVLVSELDLQAALDPKALVKLMWEPETDLREQLGADAFRALSVHLRAAMPAPVLVHTPPWIAQSMVIGFPQDPTRLPLDVEIAKVARDAGVELVYLETMEEQVALMESLEEDFVEGLRIGGEAATEAADELTKMAAACVEGDAAALADATDSPEDADVLSRLFDVRNQAWADRVRTEVAQGGAFVAVGAGHLLGPTGLVAQLEGAGFQLTKLTTTAPPSANAATLTAVAPAVPPPLDPTRVQAWMAVLETPGGAVSRVCEDGGLVRTCYVPDAAACAQRLHDDLALCAEQYADMLPELAVGSEPPMAGLQALLACGMASLALEALATDGFGEDPVCVAQRDGMITAMELQTQQR